MIHLQENRLVNKALVTKHGAFEVLQGDKGIVLIPLDLQLPKFSGHEALRFTLSIIMRVPVVILTSAGEDKDIIESYDRGANSYVRKPVAFNESLKANKQLGMYRLLLNAGRPKRGGY